MKKFFTLLILAAATIGATSCVKNGDFSPGGEAHLVLKLQTPNYGPGTRAMAATKESEIENLWVLVFSMDDVLNRVTITDIVKADITGTESGVTTAEISIPESKLGVDATKFMILANSESILSSTIGLTFAQISANADIGTGSYDDVIALINGGFTSAYSTGSTIPMWVETDQTNITATSITGGIAGTKTLLRALARIDVGVGTPTDPSGTGYSQTTWNGETLASGGTPVPFQLGEVYIYSARNQFAVIPNVVSGSPALTVPSTSEKLDTDSDAETFEELTYSGVVDDLYITREIYVPEANILMGAAANAAWGDDNHTNRMAIVVKGKYDSNGDGDFTDHDADHDDRVDYYYRIDFKVNGSDDLRDVLRNHLYRFNITSVSKAGALTADEAYESKGTQITVNVEDWSLVDIPPIHL